MDYREKRAKVAKKTIRDLNLRLVKPVSANEINKLKVLLKNEPQELWKYLQKKELYQGKK